LTNRYLRHLSQTLAVVQQSLSHCRQRDLARPWLLQESQYDRWKRGNKEAKEKIMNARRMLLVAGAWMAIGAAALAQGWETDRNDPYGWQADNLPGPAAEVRGYGALYPASVTTTTTTRYQPYAATAPAYFAPRPQYVQPQYAPTYTQTNYAQPVYTQPAYAAPNYAAPAYTQPVYAAAYQPAYAVQPVARPVYVNAAYRPCATTYAAYQPVTYAQPAVAPVAAGPRVWVHEKVYVEGQPLRNLIKAITP
jgi:hypothetical protein